MTQASSPLREPTCPLCGGANRCAVASTGSFDAPCWCTQATFAPELLASVPAAGRGVACICARCASKAPDTAGHSASQALTIQAVPRSE